MAKFVFHFTKTKTKKASFWTVCMRNCLATLKHIIFIVGDLATLKHIIFIVGEFGLQDSSVWAFSETMRETIRIKKADATDSQRKKTIAPAVIAATNFYVSERPTAQELMEMAYFL